MPNLILRPSNLADKNHKWVLQLRYHESYGETEYVDIKHMSAEMARDILAAKTVELLFPGKKP